MPYRTHSQKNRSGRFVNPQAPPQRFAEFLRWLLNRQPGPWSPRDLRTVPSDPPAPRVEGDALTATFINHSTVLLQTAGLNILTDPVWSERCSPFSFAGPRRNLAPGVALHQLPRIDQVLLSHNHYDHLDLPTLQALNLRDRPVIHCPLGTERTLRSLIGSAVHAYDWWQQRSFNGFRVTCVPAQHFAARGITDRNCALWSGFILETAARTIYFAGDTGFCPYFAEIHEAFPQLDLALLPIGAYAPEWFMGPIHMTPEQAVVAWQILGAPHAIAIHHGTFPLADDGEREPVERLTAALTVHPERERFNVLSHGEAWRTAL